MTLNIIHFFSVAKQFTNTISAHGMLAEMTLVLLALCFICLTSGGW